MTDASTIISVYSEGKTRGIYKNTFWRFNVLRNPPDSSVKKGIAIEHVKVLDIVIMREKILCYFSNCAYYKHTEKETYRILVLLKLGAGHEQLQSTKSEHFDIKLRVLMVVNSILLIWGKKSVLGPLNPRRIRDPLRVSNYVPGLHHVERRRIL